MDPSYIKCFVDQTFIYGVIPLSMASMASSRFFVVLKQVFNLWSRLTNVLAAHLMISNYRHSWTFAAEVGNTFPGIKEGRFLKVGRRKSERK